MEYHGSIVLVALVSEKAQAWCDQHMQPDALTFADAYVVEPGYFGAFCSASTRPVCPLFEAARKSGTVRVVHMTIAAAEASRTLPVWQATTCHSVF